jgi:phosphotransacetylase
MDIERTMEFIVEQLARSEAAHAKWEARVNQHDKEIEAIRRNLSRAVKAGILEARKARKRHQEFDEKMTQLAAAQLITEEKQQAADHQIALLAAAQLVTEQKLQAYIESRRKDTHGHS